MKLSFNLTTDPYDLGRFDGREDFLAYREGFDGVELMELPGCDAGWLTPQDVVGVHLPYETTWYDFWRGNERELLAEFGDWAQVEEHYGSLDPHVLVENLRAAFRSACAWDPDYVVYHVAESTSYELFWDRFERDDADVIDAAAEILNEALAGQEPGPTLLLENLWENGFTFTDPALTHRMLDAVRYPDVGVLLDTGHLLHTDRTLRTMDEACAYLARMVEAHRAAGLLPRVRGMHLQASLTGAYRAGVAAKPPALSSDYRERVGQLFEYSFQIDRHEPFVAESLDGVLAGMPLDYMTYEFITADRAEHAEFLARQRASMKGVLAASGHLTERERAGLC